MRWRRPGFVASFLVLPLTLYCVFVVSPYVQAFYAATTDWRGFSDRKRFVGLDNFRRLLDDDLFWAGIKHNLVILVVLPAVTIALGLFFASMLNIGRTRRVGVRGVRGSGLYKVIYFFPQVLSIAVIAVLWQFVYNPRTGLLNAFLDAVGLSALRQSWLGDPGFALWSVIAVMVWSSVGFYVVLFSAAMQNIPRELYESAQLDGAGRFSTLWRLTVPLLWDNVQVAFIYLSIAALDAFAIVQIMTVGPGGPDNSTEVIGLTLYRRAFDDGDFGYASAMGVVLFLMTLTLAVLVMRLAPRERTS